MRRDISGGAIAVGLITNLHSPENMCLTSAVRCQRLRDRSQANYKFAAGEHVFTICGAVSAAARLLSGELQICNSQTTCVRHLRLDFSGCGNVVGLSSNLRSPKNMSSTSACDVSACAILVWLITNLRPPENMCVTCVVRCQRLRDRC